MPSSIFTEYSPANEVPFGIPMDIPFAGLFGAGPMATLPVDTVNMNVDIDDTPDETIVKVTANGTVMGLQFDVTVNLKTRKPSVTPETDNTSNSHRSNSVSFHTVEEAIDELRRHAPNGHVGSYYYVRGLDQVLTDVSVSLPPGYIANVANTASNAGVTECGSALYITMDDLAAIMRREV